jgi:mannosyltransferase
LVVASNSLADESRAERIGAAMVVVVALVVGVALRWVWLGEASLWYDEGYTAWMVSHPMGEIIRLIRADTAPPLYYLLLRVWVDCFGHGEAALRSMSAMISTVALLAFYPLAMKLLRDRLVASLATVLFAISVMQVQHGREARFYSMMALLGEIGLFLILAAVEGPSIWVYLGSILCWAVSLYTNNMMLFYLGGLGVAWLVLPGKRSFWGRVSDLAIVSSGAAILYLPWVHTVMVQAKQVRGNFWAPAATRIIFARAVIFLAGANVDGLGEWNRYTTYFPVGFILIAIVAGLVRSGTFRRAGGLVAFGLLPLLVAFLYSRTGQSIFIDRSFIASTVAVPLLLVLPLTWVRRSVGRWVVFVVAPVLIVPGGLSLAGDRLTKPREDWRAISREIQSHPSDRQLVIFVGNEGELLFDYYARGGDYSRRSNLTGVPVDFFASNPPHTMQRVRGENDLDGLKELLGERDYDQVVFVESHPGFTDKDHLTRVFLDRTRLPIGAVAFDSVRVHRWGSFNEFGKAEMARRSILPVGKGGDRSIVSTDGDEDAE